MCTLRVSSVQRVLADALFMAISDVETACGNAVGRKGNNIEIQMIAAIPIGK